MGALSTLIGLLLLGAPLLSAAALPFLFRIASVAGGLATIVVAFRTKG